MWKAVLVGAMALTVMGTSFASAASAADAAGGRYSLQSHASGEVESKIARAKAALRLNSDQERHWPRVEAALRQIAAEKGRVQEANAGGMISRAYARASDVVLSASAVKRLVSAARPLLASLDENQKRDARQMARAMGLGGVVDQFQ